MTGTHGGPLADETAETGAAKREHRPQQAGARHRDTGSHITSRDSVQGGKIKVKQGLLTLAGLSLALAAALPASAQIGSGSITNFDQTTFNLAEAYPATAATYSANLG